MLEIFTLFSTLGLLQMISVELGAFLFAYFLIFETQINLNEENDFCFLDAVTSSLAVYWDVLIQIFRICKLIRSHIFDSNQ